MTDEIRINFDPEVNDLAEMICKLDRTIKFYEEMDDPTDQDMGVVANLVNEVDFHKARMNKIWSENQSAE